MPGPVIPNPIPDWLKPENASVTDSALTKAMRMIGHLIGADNPTAQVLGLMMTDVPGGSATGGLAKAVEGLKQRMVNAYHGSPNMLLGSVSANPVSRQFPNPQSELGAFFTLDEQEAARYADIHRKGVGGRVYQADVPLNNPKELSWNEFMGLKDVGEARAFRQQLEAAGHDGIVVRNTKGLPIEIASFKDVPLAQQPLPFQSFVKAYHGSPHDFERFSLEKIGTGEGAQAYGHGLYFAENPDVAGQYRSALAPMNATDSRMKSLLDKHQGQLDPALDEFMRGVYDTPKAKARMRDDLKELWSSRPPSGRTYEVAIHADPEDFLDWDKPLSQQSEKVKQALREHGFEDWKTTPISQTKQSWDAGSMKGASIYNAVAEDAKVSDTGLAQSAAAKTLKQAGIPGIKYLDQGSRAAYSQATQGMISQFGSREKALAGMEARLASNTDPERAGILRGMIGELRNPQTRNYVVFDDRLIDILKKYGLLLPAAGGAGQATISRRSE